MSFHLKPEFFQRLGTKESLDMPWCLGGLGRLGGFEDDFSRTQGDREISLVAVGPSDMFWAMGQSRYQNLRSKNRKGRRAGLVPECQEKHELWPPKSDWAEDARQLAWIVEHSNDAVFVRKLDGRIATWNSAAERIFGFRAQEVIGRTSERILPRGHRDEFRRLVSCIRRGQVVQHFETERLRKDGKRIFVSLTLSPVRDERGQLTGFSTIARDISEQRRAQEALQRSERALADLFEEASVGLVWTTTEGRVLRANRALLTLLECQAADCIGLPLAKFYPDRAVLADLSRRLNHRETIRNLQSTFRTLGGDLRHVLIDASAFWENGKVVHLRWFVRDISRRKQLEREVLAISERERAAFSRELHDSLGQQLSGIAYLTNVLRERLREAGSPEAEQAHSISNLLKEAIAQARAVARGLSPIRPEPDGLHGALKELADQSRKLFGMACDFRCPKPVLVVDSDTANHLYRIAQEAVHNAFRHGRAKRVIIDLTRIGNEVCLKIIDNGKGIGTLSPRRKGLGLRIMQYRAGLLQGMVSVRQRPEGGTEVRCMAPGLLATGRGAGYSVITT
jgi:PAS domain S-box-containing protein